VVQSEEEPEQLVGGWRGAAGNDGQCGLHTTCYIAFAYLPDATMDTWLGCGEYLGYTENFPHLEISQKLRSEFVWRLGIWRQLELMGREHEEQSFLYWHHVATWLQEF
jgi:hypothetical protein